jgi:hypothetical protein
MNPTVIKIDEVEYVRKDSVKEMAKEIDGKPFVIVRSYGAGVFAGYLSYSKPTVTGMEVMLDHCIRLHRWTGCSLSQVANNGIAGDGENRFSMLTENHQIFNVIEIIPCTEQARIAIQAVKTWKL